MASVRNEVDPQPQEAPNAVLFQMMLYYKEAMEAAEEKLEVKTRGFQAVVDHLVQEINTRDEEISARTQTMLEMERRMAQMRHGGEILVRSNDELYAISLWSGSRDARQAAMAAMTRADVGFAILNGAPFVDLTMADLPPTPTDPDETETEDENEAMEE